MFAFAGIDGFLPWRASLMLDVVFLAMFVVLPVLAISIRLAQRGRYAAHKRLQVALGLLLLVAVGLFELDIQINGWEQRAEASRYYASGAVFAVLIVHLVFAVTAALLWIIVIVAALRNFAAPPAPGPHSGFHRRWGKLAAWDMLLTAVTGWVFYVVAFVL